MSFLNKKNLIFIILSYFIIYFFYKIGFDKNVSFKINISFLNLTLIILLKILSITLIALRWRRLINYLKLNLILSESFKQITFGQFFSIFVPSTIAIDYFKINGLQRFNKKIKLPSAFGIDFIDRIIGLTGFLLLNTFFVAMFFINDVTVIYKFIFVIFIIILTPFIILNLSKKIFRKIILSKDIFRNLNAKQIILLFFLSLGSHFCDLIALLVVSQTFLDLPLINQMSIIGAGQYSQIISLTPSALGITETAFVYVFDFFKISQDSYVGFNIPYTVRIINYGLLTFMVIILFTYYEIKK